MSACALSQEPVHPESDRSLTSTDLNPSAQPVDEAGKTTDERSRFWWVVAGLAPCLVAPLWLATVPVVDGPAALNGLSGMLLALCLGAAVVTDLRARRIRNWTCYPTIAFALLVNGTQSLLQWNGASEVARHLGGIGFVPSLLGTLICFSGMFAMFLVFEGGAGDVKFVAALGALVGWYDGFQIWLCSMLLAGLFALGYSVLSAMARSAWFRAKPWLGLQIVLHGLLLKSEVSPELMAGLKQRIPLAPFFTVGTIIVLGMEWFQPGTSFLNEFLSVL